RHLHAAVAGAAVVVAQDQVRPRLVGADRNADRLSRCEVLVEAELAREEAVGDVLARDLEDDRLALLQVDLLRLELEPCGGDGNDARRVGAGRRAGDRGHGGGHDGGDGDESQGVLHDTSPSRSSCWMPTVPAYSRSVSSTCSTSGRAGGRSLTRRRPRFWN